MTDRPPKPLFGDQFRARIANRSQDLENVARAERTPDAVEESANRFNLAVTLHDGLNDEHG